MQLQNQPKQLKEYLMAIMTSQATRGTNPSISIRIASKTRKNRLALHITITISTLLPLVSTQYQISFLQNQQQFKLNWNPKNHNFNKQYEFNVNVTNSSSSTFFKYSWIDTVCSTSSSKISAISPEIEELKIDFFNGNLVRSSCEVGLGVIIPELMMKP